MPSFDCFLSHNSKDKPAVRALKLALEAQGLRCWLDEEQLRPGLPWQSLLEQGIKGADSVAVCVAADGIGPWEDEEMRAALTLAVRDGRAVIPVVLPGAPVQPELPLFLSSRTWVDLRDGYNGEGLARLVWGITGKPLAIQLPITAHGGHPTGVTTDQTSIPTASTPIPLTAGLACEIPKPRALVQFSSLLMTLFIKALQCVRAHLHHGSQCKTFALTLR